MNLLSKLAYRFDPTLREACAKAATIDQIRWEHEYPDHYRMFGNLTQIMDYMREDDQENAVDRIVDEHRRFHRALAWYAKPDNWLEGGPLRSRDGPCTHFDLLDGQIRALIDKGERARVALGSEDAK